MHHDIVFFLVIISVFVLYLLIRVVTIFHETKKTNYIKVVHGKAIETIWTIAPSFVLALIAIPSFALLYSMDEIIDPAVTIKAIGHQ